MDKHRRDPPANGVSGASRVRQGAKDLARFELAMVADLRETAADHPADDRLRALIAGLRARSERFAELWDSGAVGRHASGRKAIIHPSVGRSVGEIVLDCDVLTVPGAGDLRIVAYTAGTGEQVTQTPCPRRVVRPGEIRLTRVRGCRSGL